MQARPGVKEQYADLWFGRQRRVCCLNSAAAELTSVILTSKDKVRVLKEKRMFGPTVGRADHSALREGSHLSGCFTDAADREALVQYAHTISQTHRHQQP